MCGSVMKTQPSYTFTETTGTPRVLAALRDAPEADAARSARASRSVRPGSRSSRPGTSALLANYQAICLPYDGTKSLPARRVYLKPHYLPRERGYWRLREEGRL